MTDDFREKYDFCNNAIIQHVSFIPEEKKDRAILCYKLRSFTNTSSTQMFFDPCSNAFIVSNPARSDITQFKLEDIIDAENVLRLQKHGVISIFFNETISLPNSRRYKFHMYAIIDEERLNHEFEIGVAEKYAMLLSDVIHLAMEYKTNFFDFKKSILKEARYNPKPVGLPLNLKPHQYANVQWMIKREKQSTTPLFLSPHKTMFELTDELLYDHIQRMIYEKSKLPFLNIDQKLYIRGGALFDDTGVGKSRCIIALAKENPYSDDSHIENTDGSRSRHEMIMGDKSFNLFRSRATLVVCPNQMSKVWAKYVRNFDKNFKVCVIATKTNAERVSLQDIIDADFVITTSAYLKNLYFLQCAKRMHFGVSGKEVAVKEPYKTVLENYLRWMNYWTTFARKLERDERKTLFSVPMHAIFWHRIVLDEVNEMFGRFIEKYAYLVNNFRCRYKWVLTGTPCQDTIVNSLNWLAGIKVIKNSDTVEPSIYSPTMKPWFACSPRYQAWLAENIFRRNTPLSIREVESKEFLSVNINEEVFWLDMTQQEIALYESAMRRQTRQDDIFKLLQICSHPFLGSKVLSQIKDLKLQDVNKVMITHFQTKIRDAEHRLNNHIGEYKKVRKELEELKSQKTYFESTVEKIMNDDESVTSECPICLSSLTGIYGIARCGHVFCWNCLQRIFQQSRQCCICRYKFTSNHDIRRVMKASPPSASTATTSEVNKMIETHGTKLAHIIDYIRKNKSKKIILFSQWNKLLKNICHILMQEGVKISNCTGNVYVKQKAIENFSNDECTILAMSNENYPSGINLSVADTIIFAEPIYEYDPEKIKHIETQAVGRVVRLGRTKTDLTIARFLTKNTIEAELFNRRFS